MMPSNDEFMSYLNSNPLLLALSEPLHPFYQLCTCARFVSVYSAICHHGKSRINFLVMIDAQINLRNHAQGGKIMIDM